MQVNINNLTKTYGDKTAVSIPDFCMSDNCRTSREQWFRKDHPFQASYRLGKGRYGRSEP